MSNLFCRIYEREGERETWEHMWEECMGQRKGKGWQQIIGKVFRESGEGEEWMKELENFDEFLAVHFEMTSKLLHSNYYNT